MAKPILITRIPKGSVLNVDTGSLYKQLRDSAPDYNHIALFEGRLKKLTFEVFNVQDYKQIDFEKLKEQLCNKDSTKS